MPPQIITLFCYIELYKNLYVELVPTKLAKLINYRYVDCLGFSMYAITLYKNNNISISFF